MPLDLVTIPCLTDNYAFLLHNRETGETCLFDAPEAAPIEACLAETGWRLDALVISHFHDDHVEGVAALREAHGCRVIGPAADAHRLPPLDLEVREGDEITLCGEAAQVIDVSGETIGQIALYLPDSRAVLSADCLFALGCGRLFEGTPEQMWQSLLKLRALPDETLVYSGHEYAATNARFALTIEPDNPDLIARARAINEARARHQPTVPSVLGEEKRTNPFLRADRPEVKAAIGMEGADDVAVFAEIRARKDKF